MILIIQPVKQAIEAVPTRKLINVKIYWLQSRKGQPTLTNSTAGLFYSGLL